MFEIKDDAELNSVCSYVADNVNRILQYMIKTKEKESLSIDDFEQWKINKHQRDFLNELNRTIRNNATRFQENTK